MRVSSPLSDTESSGLLTPAVIEALGLSSALADVLGRTQIATTWRSAADAMTKAFRRYLVVTDTGGERVVEAYDRVSGAVRGHLQAAQIRPVLNGLVSAAAAERILDRDFPDPVAAPPAGVRPWNTPTWGYYLLRALTESGRGSRAVAHLLDRYGRYLPGDPRNPLPLVLQGPLGGPLPEYMISRVDEGLAPRQPLETQPLDATGSHGWAAVPLVWMHDTLLGVRILEPGGARLEIAPRSAGLPYVSGTTMTPHGPVYVHLEASRPALVVEVPSGTACSLILPDEFDGIVAVLHDGTEVASPLLLGPGRHEITAKSLVAGIGRAPG